ncbi:M20/M25/M40 family metallo-hydrolase [Rhodohalobacter sp. 614A]|uniref:M20/M25/M40 family metallo-hydrolase n=1 Tax=Rhodohalobacter sp. 614A TaxID=2908649 RepID=UPI001F1F9AC4|nr:M20/M25/M40 family metallo-hydrolase [Rhodohalobacter sp. 614A]
MTDFKPLEKKLNGLEKKLKKYRELLLANLVMVGEIPAPTFGEEDRIKFILNRFDEAGLTDSSIDDQGNGVGVLSGKEGKSSILLNAHADTIFSAKTDHTMQVSSGSITGPGVADNSLGLAALMTLPYILEDLDIELKKDLVLLAGVQSLGRGNLEGIRFFLENNPFKISDAICLEGIQLGRLSYSSIGMFRGEITCTVPESYDWSRFGDASAILTLNEVINKINDIRLPKRPRTSIVMGSIVGGTSFNTIARDATLGFEVRSESQEVVEKAGETIQDIVMEVSSKTGDQVELDIFAKRSPGGIPFAHPLTNCARVVMESLDIEPRLAPSTSELSALIDEKIPALTLGITVGERTFKTNETIQIEPIFKGLAQLIGIILAVDGGYCE